MKTPPLLSFPLLFLLTSALPHGACGDEHTNELADAGVGTVDGQRNNVDASTVDAWPSIDASTEPIDPNWLDGEPQTLPSRDHHVVYLNFVGGVVRQTTSNAHRNQSAAGFTGTEEFIFVPPFHAQRFFRGHIGDMRTRDAIISSIVTLVEELYAPVDLQFTTTRPTDAEFLMVLIGGAYEGWWNGSSANGVTGSGTCDGVVPNGVAHTFPLSFDQSQGNGFSNVALTTVHEIGHMLGLRHSQNPDSLMHSPRTNDGWAVGSPVGNLCPRKIQDDLAVLQENLGTHIARAPLPANEVDAAPPQVAIVRTGQQVTITVTDASPTRYISLRVFRESNLPAFNNPLMLHESFVFASTATLDVSAYAGATLEVLVPDRWDNLAVEEVEL